MGGLVRLPHWVEFLHHRRDHLGDEWVQANQPSLIDLPHRLGPNGLGWDHAQHPSADEFGFPY
jgi:hypothetical protein